MTKKFFALIALVLITSSCSIYHVSSIEETDAYLPSKESIDDVVYLEDLEGKDYTVIGKVTVNGERKQRSFDEVIIKMRREAAVIGGDAITDIQTDASGAWKKLATQEVLKNAYVRANFTATVVIFGNPEDRDLLKIDPPTEEPAPEDLSLPPVETSDAQPLAPSSTIPLTETGK